MKTLHGSQFIDNTLFMLLVFVPITLLLGSACALATLTA